MAVTASCSHPPLPAYVVGAPAATGVMMHYRRPYATFKIQVDASGKVTGATLEEGTGDSALDDASAAAVRQWTFTPAMVNCKAVAGTAEYAVPVGLAPYTYKDPCDHDVTVAKQAVPEFPDQARDMRGTSQVRISVSVDSAGRVTDVGISTSSGNTWLDRSALDASMQSNYLPGVHGCAPVSGKYLFLVTFE